MAESMTTANPVEAFEVINHGIDYPDYFPGCGVAFSDFTDVATGIGDTEAEALDDALEQLACAGWELSGLEDQIIECYGKPGNKSIPAKYGDDSCRYISIRVR